MRLVSNQPHVSRILAACGLSKAAACRRQRGRGAVDVPSRRLKGVHCLAANTLGQKLFTGPR